MRQDVTGFVRALGKYRWASRSPGLLSRSLTHSHCWRTHSIPFHRSLVLLDKAERRKVDYKPDYIGFPVSGHTFLACARLPNVDFCAYIQLWRGWILHECACIVRDHVYAHVGVTILSAHALLPGLT